MSESVLCGFLGHHTPSSCRDQSCKKDSELQRQSARCPEDGQLKRVYSWKEGK